MVAIFTKIGIRVPSNKKLTAHKPIEVAPVPKKVILPLLQHSGEAARPSVQIGDRVKTGDKIGEAKGPTSANIHASISGKIINIMTERHPLLKDKTLACIIEGDGQDQWTQARKEHPDYERLSSPDLLKIVREAGIVGLGGGAFPTDVKLSSPTPIHTLIINGCECEPYRTADHRLMVENSAGVVAGAKIFARIVNCRKVIFAVEKNKPDAIKAIKTHSAHLAGFSVATLPTRYPQGAEKFLIKTITKKEVPRGGLPQDIGVLVHNVATCFATWEAVRSGKPLIERVVTVTGPGIKIPKNLKVRIGTPISELVRLCGGFTHPAVRLILGGPMTGAAAAGDALPVIKGLGSILVLTPRHRGHPVDCIRCGRCVEVCPMRLMPCLIEASIEIKDFARAQSCGLSDCLECGSCAYVCPAHRELVYRFCNGKTRLAKK